MAAQDMILQDFVIRAKKATYVGDGARAPSSRLGSHDLTFADGDWAYRDSYFGGIDFLGQEVVWHRGEPVWSMCYYGFILRPDLITATQAGNVLKAALSKPEAQGRLLDNLQYVKNGFDYAIASEGSIERFKGRETIHMDGVLSYALDYFGGVVKE
jgi:hypothetical protein